jgi:hypothetical protein
VIAPSTISRMPINERTVPGETPKRGAARREAAVVRVRLRGVRDPLAAPRAGVPLPLPEARWARATR